MKITSRTTTLQTFYVIVLTELVSMSKLIVNFLQTLPYLQLVLANYF